MDFEGFAPGVITGLIFSITILVPIGSCLNDMHYKAGNSEALNVSAHCDKDTQGSMINISKDNKWICAEGKWQKL